MTGPWQATRPACAASTSASAARGTCWWPVGRPATIGGVAVARDTGIAVGYLPGVSMRRIADLTPGERQD